ncbi:Rap1 GTPase-GDP dissociation stimulator 1 [Coemansia erecta]|uniref:Rap1 GTPase-GDP dissociation stimulator 1 n=1 Tax=Coemansia erecta TaxID=147472 RepID=A0A9W8CS74_9FUNG|nr:Rap1 GTPase-GDP dissociation stimulator 1 [Coemansia erecta]
MVIPTHIRRSTDMAGGASAAKTWLAEAAQWGDLDAASQQASIAPVLAYLSSQADFAVSADRIVDTAKAFQSFADLSRSPALRQTLTTTTDLSRISSAYLTRTATRLTSPAAAAAAAVASAAEDAGTSSDSRAESVFLLVQVLRCICNLSADNDAARAQVLASGGVDALAEALAVDEVWRQPQPVGQAAFGAVLNVSLDYAPCGDALVAHGALRLLLKALAPETAHVPGAMANWPLVSMAIDGLCTGGSQAAAVRELEAHADYAQSILRSLTRLARLLADDGAGGEDGAAAKAMRGAQRTLLWTLLEAVEKSPQVARQLAQPESVLGLFDLLDHFLASGGGGDDDNDGDETDGEGEGEDAAGANGPQDAAEPSRPMPPNRPMPAAANRRADAVTQLIVAASGDDAALEALFGSQPLLNRLVGILSADRGSAQNARTQRLDGMAAAAALCLGNLARTDAHCTRLVDGHAALVRTLIHEWFAPRTTNVRTRHAASGLLKNLAMPAANKRRLAGFGVVGVACANIDTMVVPIQANAIGILRHLLTAADEADAGAVVLAMLQPMRNSRGQPAVAMRDLLAAVRETDIDAIRCEGTRLLAAVAKRVYLGREPHAAARDLIRSAPYDLATPLVRLILVDGRRHPLLRQECLVALTVLAATSLVDEPHVADIVRLLSPPNSLPLCVAGSPDQDSGKDEEDQQEGEDRQEPLVPCAFSDMLAKVVSPDADVWPQTALQAKGLLAGLRDQLAGALADPSGAEAQRLDADGLRVLRDELLPLV